LLQAQQNCECFFRDLSEKYEQKNIQLIHVWEDVWRLKKEQVEARIAALLGKFTRYHARLTEVKKITNPVLVDFLQQHHLQVAIGGRYKYGLFFKGEIVAVASFSAVRPMLRNGVEYRSHELLRFANKTGCVVAGGLSKLLSHFIAEQNPDDVMSYVDRDWGSGKGYKILGFEQVGELPPQLFLLDTKINLRYYEHQKNANENIVTICNSGSYKFIKDVKKMQK
ncbi:MAG: hypothetical protein LBU92_04735, partial [Prevotellaceae bacterium]|nr:hypothetical protein [Prevotellaceae bacterium]